MNQSDPSPDRPLRLGTRSSALALAQTSLTINLLQRAYPSARIETCQIQTEGDRDKMSPLTEIGGMGVFTNAIERRIVSGVVDAAVHSAKDLPTALHPHVPIVAFPDRADPRDVLVSWHGVTLDNLPDNPLIGTSSRRREAQIARLRPDARFANLRGNVDTRLRKAQGADFDAIVLAAAGVSRMGWTDLICEYFPIERLVPSPGQGAIAVQALIGSNAARWLASIDDPRVSVPVRIERAYLAAIGPGCTMPVGAHASAQDDGLRLVAMVANADGTRIAFADELLANDNARSHAADIAARLMAEIGEPSKPQQWNGWQVSHHDLSGARVVVTRPRPQAQALVTVLVNRGAEPLSLPMIRIEAMPDSSALDTALRDSVCGKFAWIAFTSANAVSVVAERLHQLEIQPWDQGGVKLAAVGAATASAAREAGWHVLLVPDSSSAERLAEMMLSGIEPGERVLYPRSAIGRNMLPDALRAGGLDVVTIDAYRTAVETDVDPAIVDQVRRGDVDVIAFASPSSVTNFCMVFAGDRRSLQEIPAICAGPVTAKAARDAGLRVVAVSADPGATSMADALAAYWNGRTTASAIQSDRYVMAKGDAMKGRVE